MTDQTTETEPREPDNPAAWALAQHIADHPMSTVQAAFRYLNAPLAVELHEQPADEARTCLLQALDASYCQALGHTPEGLLAAYEASRTQTVDQAALSAKLWEIAERHIVAEWICCEPLEPGHDLCAKGYAALGMVKSLLVDADPGEAWNPSAPLLSVLATVLPATTNHDTDTGVPLSETERKMLEYALDLADEEIATDGSDFTDEEEDALAELRRIVTKPIATGTFELRGDTEIRAAALREAADVVAAHPGPIPYRPQLDEDGGFWWDTRDRDAVVALLRRVADETAATETSCWCGHPEDRHWTGATDMTFTDGCHDCHGWNGAHVYGQELPWLPEGAEPAAGAPQDGSAS
ncbi:hypothetical protein ACFWMH_27685 [Streptomyces tendae]|uniref:hypothetical protein n=1 Tax=Streptomyces tendae TaxID=1932 RepID=UPI0036655EA4